MLPAQHAQQVKDGQQAQAEAEASLQESVNATKAGPNPVEGYKGAGQASGDKCPRADQHIERWSLGKDPSAPEPDGG